MVKPLIFVRLTRNDPVKCVVCLVAPGRLHVNCCDKHEKYITLTAMIWVTCELLIFVTQRSCEDISVN